MSDSICLYKTMSLSSPSQLVPSSSSHALTFLTSSLSFHNILFLVSSTALDIQHFLRPLKMTFGETCCHAIMICLFLIIHWYFLVYKLTWTHQEDSQYSPQMVLVVLRILTTCVPDLCVVSVVWSVKFRVLFMGFNLWIHPGFIFESHS